MDTQPRAQDRAQGRSQDRSVRTRRKVLGAAVACLGELGYAKTTTLVVAERAGVSRGALRHHFPTRDALLLAALERVFDRDLSAFRQLVSALPESERGPAVIDFLWRTMRAPKWHGPWIELVVAGRSAPRLRARLAELMIRLRAQMKAAFHEELGNAGLPEAVVTFTTALIDGLLVQQLAGLSDADIDAALELLRSLASLLNSPEVST